MRGIHLGHNIFRRMDKDLGPGRCLKGAAEIWIATKAPTILIGLLVIVVIIAVILVAVFIR